MLETLLLIVSVLIIAIVLLQSNKASDAGQIITGGNETLFQNMKERGVELFISRLTLLLGLLFFGISLYLFLNAVEEAELNCTVNGTSRTYGENLLGAAERGSTYATWQEVAQTILAGGCANIANEVFSSKMGQAYSGDDESYIESPYSRKSFADFYDNIVSIRNSLYGSFDAATASSRSLLALLRKYHKTEAAALESALEEAFGALQACIDSNVSFAENCTKGDAGSHAIQDKVKSAIDAVSSLNDALEEASSAIKD